jgi:hypothetical protein
MVTVGMGRRRRTTTVAAVAAVGGLLLTGGLTYAGARTLWNSTEGSDAGSGATELFFPDTPTALLAGLDEDGALASLSVVVVQPDGAGATVVPIPVSADATAGEGEERLPIAETVALQGTDAVAREVEITLGLSLDAVEVADADRLAELLAPVGEVDVELPADVTDANGDVVAEAGAGRFDASELAGILTARDPDQPAAEQFGAAAAVWDGVSAAVGDGVTEPPAEQDGAAADGIDATMTAAMAGPLRSWTVRWRPIEPERNPRRVDNVLLDRPELAVLFGQIAPGRVSAPNPSIAVRLVVPFSDEQLGDRGWTNADVAYRAASQVLFLRGNVISVDTTADEAPATTRVEVIQPGISTAGAEAVFGELDVVEADERIVGVDAVLHLGETYLEFLDAADAAEDGTVESIPAAGADVDPVSSVPATTND